MKQVANIILNPDNNSKLHTFYINYKVPTICDPDPNKNNIVCIFKLGASDRLEDKIITRTKSVTCAASSVAKTVKGWFGFYRKNK